MIENGMYFGEASFYRNFKQKIDDLIIERKQQNINNVQMVRDNVLYIVFFLWRKLLWMKI